MFIHTDRDPEPTDCFCEEAIWWNYETDMMYISPADAKSYSPPTEILDAAGDVVGTVLSETCAWKVDQVWEHVKQSHLGKKAIEMEAKTRESGHTFVVDVAENNPAVIGGIIAMCLAFLVAIIVAGRITP